MIFIKRVLFLLASLFYSQSCLAVDVIKANLGQTANDIRTKYKIAVLEQSLKLTEEKYGPYKIIPSSLLTKTHRAILEIQSGKNINVFVALTTNEWEQKAIPIRIPIRRGLLNYRLLLIHKDNIDKFKQVDNIADLKKIKVGLLKDWATYSVLAANGFNVLGFNSYTGLFSVLSSQRVDYVPRGINEIDEEKALFDQHQQQLVVEPSLALHYPAPTYIFVSPNAPKIAKRIQEGLEMMVENKLLEAIFNEYYAEKIAKAKLAERKIIYVNNPLLPPKTPLDNKALWWSPFD
ncbi:MAG: hypothetical protein ACSHW0_01545 [Thalassotalea sp.]